MAFFSTGPLYKFGCWSTSLRNSNSFLAAWTRSKPRVWQNGSWYIFNVSVMEQGFCLKKIWKKYNDKKKTYLLAALQSHTGQIFIVFPTLHLIWHFPSKLFEPVVNDLERKRKENLRRDTVPCFRWFEFNPEFTMTVSLRDIEILDIFLM